MLFRSVFIKGMPTGIEISRPPTGSSGYWSSIFIFINADYLDFDLGRKTVSPPTHRLIQSAASTIFSEISPIACYVFEDRHTGSTPPGKGKKKKKLLNELNNLPNLGITSICYQKFPNKQEAAVVAIFHELLGAGLIKGYHGIGWSYGAKYDMYARYTGMINDLIGSDIRGKILEENDNDPLIDDEITIEFKYKAESVLVDIENSVKEFQEIDVLICWELDEEEFSDKGIVIAPLKKEKAYYNGANYSAMFPVMYDMGEINSKKSIIALKQFIEQLQRNS